MLDDTRDQNLLIPTRHHVVPKSIGKIQTKEDTDGFSGCNNMTMTKMGTNSLSASTGQKKSQCQNWHGAEMGANIYVSSHL